MQSSTNPESNRDELFPEDLSIEEWLEALTDEDSAVRKAWVRENQKATVRRIEAALHIPHEEGQRLHGVVVQDLRVNDGLLIEINDEEVSLVRYELPDRDCQMLNLQPGMRISGVVSFLLASRWKGSNPDGRPVWRKGAIVPGSVHVFSPD